MGWREARLDLCHVRDSALSARNNAGEDGGCNFWRQASTRQHRRAAPDALLEALVIAAGQGSRGRLVADGKSDKQML
jgi:hypothetical protein